MRLWSIKLSYLDSIGLVALWREALLGKNVILGKTKGYKNHPQLQRFQNTKNPLLTINSYLETIYIESVSRGFKFNKLKIGEKMPNIILDVAQEQVIYEFKHLQNKLKVRNLDKYNLNSLIDKVETNNFFNIIPGEIESWEVIKVLNDY